MPSQTEATMLVPFIESKYMMSTVSERPKYWIIGTSCAAESDTEIKWMIKAYGIDDVLRWMQQTPKGQLPTGFKQWWDDFDENVNDDMARQGRPKIDLTTLNLSQLRRLLSSCEESDDPCFEPVKLRMIVMSANDVPDLTLC